MRTGLRLALLAAGVAALAAAWRGGPGTGGRGAREEPPAQRLPRSAPGGPADPLRLHGRRGSAPERGPGWGAPPNAPGSKPSEPLPRTADAAQRLADLANELRRTVEPTRWTEGGGWAIAVQGGGSLVVSAPLEVQNAIARLLDSKRKALARQAGPNHPDAHGVSEGDRAQALAALQRLLLRIVEQCERLHEARSAYEDGRSADFERLLDAMAAEEPDLALVRSARAALAAPDPERSRQQLSLWGLRVELMAGGDLTLDALVLQWPSPASLAACEQARVRAGLAAYARPASEVDEALRTARVDLDLTDVPVAGVLGRLRALTRVEVRPDLHVPPDLLERRLPRFEVRGRPLGEALETLLRLLPAGYEVRRLAAAVTLTRTGSVPVVVVQVFSVGDLVDPRPPGESEEVFMSGAADAAPAPTSAPVPPLPDGSAPPPAPPQALR